MRISTRHLFIFFLVTVGAAPGIARACEPIDSLPAKLDRPGTYCLQRSFLFQDTSALAAIEIQSDHVTIDFAGYGILSTVPSSCETGPAGVFASDRLDITVRDGELIGFNTGVWLGSSAPSRFVNSVVEGMEIRQSGCLGIHLGGTGSVLRDNIVGLSGGGSPTSEGVGIGVSGIGNHVVGNDVQWVVTGSAAGPTRYGIYTSNYAAHNLIEANRISHAEPAIWMISSSDRYRDNVAINAGQNPYQGGTDLGGND